MFSSIPRRAFTAIVLFFSLLSTAEAQVFQLPCNCEAGVDVVATAGTTVVNNIIPVDGPCDPWTAQGNPPVISGCDNGEGCVYLGSATFTASNGDTDTISPSSLPCDDSGTDAAYNSAGGAIGVVITSCSECKT
jgi:hypothetical protein